MPPSHAVLPSSAGIGLRAAHHGAFSERRPSIGWIEVHTENFLGFGPARDLLFILRDAYAISLHGVGLSLGTAEGLDEKHLRRVADLVETLNPASVSEHVSWSVTGGIYYNDLIPLPYDTEALAVLADNIKRFQDMIGRQVLVENPSTYLRYDTSTMAEPEFIAELCRISGCGLLLDINNVYVSARNHGYSAESYLQAIADTPIGEMHLSGHFVRRLGNREIRIDDHGSPVTNEVWDLYRYAIDRIGPKPTLVEWDSDIPELDKLLSEAAIAQDILDLFVRT